MNNLNKENIFISNFKSSLNGDDGAYCNGFIYSTDSFFENVHFKREWMTLKQIAAKSMLVNISDAIAMNAKPKFALLNVAIPNDLNENDLKELADGFNEVANEFGIQIIGGDTICNSKLDISVTIISKTKKPLFRKGMQNHDLIAYTGNLGASKKDLNELFDGKKIDDDSKFIKPKLYPKFIKEIRSLINCGMDISDGLFFELERLSRANNLGISLLQDFSNDVGCSGEEYEMLFSFPKQHRKEILRIAKKHKLEITIAAKATKGDLFVCNCKPHHF